jgi:hypothetical protein
MSPQELDAIYRQQIIVCDQSSYRTQIPGVEYAFQTRSTNSPLSYTRLPASLGSLQTARDTVAQRVQAMQSLPLSDQGYEMLEASHSAVVPYLPLVWPSERRAFERARTLAQARLAPAALASKMEALLAAPSSIDSLRALREAPSRYKEFFSQVPADPAASMRARMDARVADAGAAVVAEQRKLMLSFSGTRDGLQQGATWLQQFDAVGVKELNLPGAAELVSEYERTRQRQLAAREPELRRRIQAAPNEAALQPLLDEAYPLQSDRSTPAYAQMQQAIAQRAAIFEKQQAAQDAARQRAESTREARLSAASTPPGRDSRRRTTQTASAESAGQASFSARGLSSEAIFNAIYSGDFDKVDFGRGDARFGSVAGGYMDAYWDGWSHFLTKDRVRHCQLNGRGVNLRREAGMGVHASVTEERRQERLCATGKTRA